MGHRDVIKNVIREASIEISIRSANHLRPHLLYINGVCLHVADSLDLN